MEHVEGNLPEDDAVEEIETEDDMPEDEFDVDDIAKDIENPKWRSTSVEFCGGT